MENQTKTPGKYSYNRVIQQNYGQGWEDFSEYTSNANFIPHDKKLLRSDLAEYQLIGYPTRVISRRTTNV